MSNNNPNVLLITSSCFRADRLSCYGYGRLATPNLDRLASEAALFEQAFTTAPFTGPAHASLLTGLFPLAHGISRHSLPSEALTLDASIPTLQSVLRGLGYHSVAFVTGHHVAGVHRLDRGFDEVYWRGRMTRPPEAGAAEKPVSSRFGRLSDALSEWRWHLQNRNEGDKGGARTSECCMKWLSERGKARPFFCFLHFDETHYPFSASPECAPDLERRLGISINPNRAVETLNRNPFLMLVDKKTYGPAELSAFNDRYDRAVAYTDQLIGRVLAHLKQLALYDDCIIVFTAQHGENLGEHNLAVRIGCLYETMVRVPLILRLPSIFPARFRSAAPAQITDILPTLLTAIPGAVAPPMQGVSLVSATQMRSPRSFIFAEWHGELQERFRTTMLRRNALAEVRRLEGSHLMLRQGDYKLMENPWGDELYHLANDPAERHDVSSRYPQTMRSLKNRLREVQKELSLHTRNAASETLPSNIALELRYGGYKV